MAKNDLSSRVDREIEVLQDLFTEIAGLENENEILQNRIEELEKDLEAANETISNIQSD